MRQITKYKKQKQNLEITTKQKMITSLVTQTQNFPEI